MQQSRIHWRDSNLLPLVQPEQTVLYGLRQPRALLLRTLHQYGLCVRPRDPLYLIPRLQEPAYCVQPGVDFRM